MYGSKLTMWALKSLHFRRHTSGLNLHIPAAILQKLRFLGFLLCSDWPMTLKESLSICCWELPQCRVKTLVRLKCNHSTDELYISVLANWIPVLANWILVQVISVMILSFVDILCYIRIGKMLVKIHV